MAIVSRFPGLVSWQRPDRDPVETRDAVGLRPQPHPARTADGGVLRGIEVLAVEGDGEVVVVRLQAKKMPFVRSDFRPSPGDLLSPTFDHAVEGDVVLERVCPHDVVVLGRGHANRDAARWADQPGDRLEADGYLHILRRPAALDGKGKAKVRPGPA